MKNFKTFGGCSTALLAAFILTPSAFAQTTVQAPTNQPGNIITDADPTTGTVIPHDPVTPTTTTPGGITAIGGVGDTRATVERYFETRTTPLTPGTPTHTYDPDGDEARGGGPMDSREVEVATVNDVRNVYEIVTNADGTTTRGNIISTFAGIDDLTAAYSLDKITGVDSGGTTTHTAVNPKAIAIGASSVVRGDDSVAIGPGATVVRVETTMDIQGVPTHTYDPDGDAVRGGGPMDSREVEVAIVNGVKNVYEIVANADGTTTRGNIISTFAGIDDLTPAYSLDKINDGDTPGTTTRIAVDRATAVGANSEVQLNNGVAIGAGAKVLHDDSIETEQNGGVAIGANAVATGTGIAIGSGTAGVDENGDGDYDDAGDTAPTVAAAANEITIGGATHTGDIKIGNVVLQENGVNHIAANRDNINNNRNSIATNKNDIETNTKGIASAIAIAGLATGPGSGLSIGFGSFQSETSIAIGYDNTFGAEQNMTFKAAAASAGSGSTAGSLSMRWAF